MLCTCTICAGYFDFVKSIVATPCGHVFHQECVEQWMKQSKSCPECRSKVTLKNLQKLFMNVSPNNANNQELVIQIEDQEAQIISLRKELSSEMESIQSLRKYVGNADAENSKLEIKLYERELEIKRLKLTVNSVKDMKLNLEILERENKNLNQENEHLNFIKEVVNGSKTEADNCLRSLPAVQDTSRDYVNTLVTSCTLLKNQVASLMASKDTMRNENTDLKMKLGFNSKNLDEAKKTVKKLQAELKALNSDSPDIPTKKNVDVPNTPFLSSLNMNVNQFDLTPISCDLNNKTSSQMTFEVLDSVKSSQKRRLLDPMPECSTASSSEEGSCTRVGYNGLGGHERFTKFHVARPKIIQSRLFQHSKKYHN